MRELLCHFDFSSAAIQFKFSIHFSFCFAEILFCCRRCPHLWPDREREKLSIRLSYFVSPSLVPLEAATQSALSDLSAVGVGMLELEEVREEVGGTVETDGSVSGPVTLSSHTNRLTQPTPTQHTK